MKLNKVEKATIILATLNGHLYKEIDRGNTDLIENLKDALRNGWDDGLFEAASLHFGELGRNYEIIGTHAQRHNVAIIDDQLAMARRALQSRLGV